MKPKGFTLIELLVVIAIIGVLAALIFPRLDGARMHTYDAVVLETVSNYRNNIELAYPSGNYDGLCTSQTYLDLSAEVTRNHGEMFMCSFSNSDYRIVAKLPSTVLAFSFPSLVKEAYAIIVAPDPEPTVGEGACINSKGVAEKVQLAEVETIAFPLCQ